MTDRCIASGKYVEFLYTILDAEDETVLERVDLPVGYVHGHDSGMIEKVEAAMEGRCVGERVQVRLSPDEGFGEPDPDLTYTDDIDKVPPQFRRVGAEVEMQNDRGDVRSFVVSRIEDGKLTVDGNHPLAGRHLRFELEILTVRDATDQELRSGVVTRPGRLH